MPARIDRGARFRDLCAIATRIIAHQGLTAPTVRRVADEAGIAPNSVRHLFPTQESLLVRTAVEIGHRSHERWPGWDVGEDVRERVRLIVAALVPNDEDSRIRAQAWAAFAAQAHSDGPLGRVVRERGVNRASALSYAMTRLRWLALPEPRPTLVTLASDRSPQAPDDLEPETLLLLIVAAGLTALICDHELPLSFDAAARWLKWWEGPQLESAT